MDLGSAVQRSPASDADQAPPFIAWIAILLLVAGAVTAQIDRMIINLLVEPVKKDFGLRDTQFAALQGIAFGLFYTFMSVPIGRLADRWPRRTIIAVGIALFSLCSLGSAIAQSYGQLFLARVGVGVGEASLFPAGFALLADYFPPKRLGRALACFTMSSMLGTAIAYIFGGALIEMLRTLGAGAPGGIIHGLRWWQWAFVGAGAPGLILAPLFLLLPRPARRGGDDGSISSFGEMVSLVFARRRLFLPMFLGFSMATLVSYSLTIWTPALFVRVYGWPVGRIGFWFGCIFLLFGTSGNLFAGWLLDRQASRGGRATPLRVAAFGFLGCSLTGGLAPLMPSAPLALALLAPTIFLSSMPYPCAATALQLIVPQRSRAQISALYLTFINLVGLSIGPILVGLFTDHLFRAPTDVRYSLAIVVAVAGPMMLILLRAAMAPYVAARDHEPIA